MVANITAPLSKVSIVTLQILHQAKDQTMSLGVTLSATSANLRGREEVHQAPMMIVTRLVVQRMLLKSSDQGKMLIQLDLQETNKGSTHKEA
jgi:hypothetical protein